jgi:hypothetical protein
MYLGYKEVHYVFIYLFFRLLSSFQKCTFSSAFFNTASSAAPLLALRCKLRLIQNLHRQSELTTTRVHSMNFY